MRPLRTALFVPGNRKERVKKAVELDAYAVIIDLEDAVPVSEKESARAIVRAFLEGYSGKRTYVRINALSTSYAQEDLKSVVCKNLSGIVLPKVESPEDIFTIDKLLTDLEKKGWNTLGNY